MLKSGRKKMANKKGFCVMMGIMLTFGLVLTGCPMGTNNENNDGDSISVIYTTSTADGKTVELAIIQPSASRAIVSLPNGSTYVLKIDGVVVSKGTVVTGINGVTTFTSDKGYTFTAEIEDDTVAILDSIITDNGETITLPDFGRKNENYHQEYPFILTGDTLSINIFGRGNGTSPFLPSDPRCDTWELQNDENKGTFPIGKWVTSGNTNNEEFILFTASIMTRVSPWFDTYRYDYTINGTNLVLTSSYRVPYIPTQDEQEYIDNFHSSYETTFRAARPWIPATSTINPKATKAQIDVGEGKMLGIDFRVADHPDMTFVNDAAVIGTWEVVDFVDDPAGYNPSSPQSPQSNLWAGLRFEANGVLHQKYSSTDWQQVGSWTKGILQTGDTAPTYEIKTYEEGTYIFVQWKSRDYTIRATKPCYYVFKKEVDNGD
jgi:hypothetical protein